MWCTAMLEMSYLVSDGYVLLGLCYVFRLSCYLGGIVIIQPFFQKKGACSVHEKNPLQTTLSLESETSLKKQILLVLVFSNPWVFYLWS